LTHFAISTSKSLKQTAAVISAKKGYDAGRDRWLVRRWGLRVERHWNNWSDPGIDGRVMSVLVRKASP
jgi:hypothetical protein